MWMLQGLVPFVISLDVQSGDWALLLAVQEQQHSGQLWQCAERHPPPTHPSRKLGR